MLIAYAPAAQRNPVSKTPLLAPRPGEAAPRGETQRGRLPPSGVEHPCAIPGNDALWIDRVRRGDEEAARELVRRLYPTVLRSVRCHLPRQGSAEDLTQTVFAKVFTKLHQFSGLVPLEHWVSKITVNTCISQLAREKARPESRMSDLNEEDYAKVQRLLATDERAAGSLPADWRDLIDQLLAALSPEERLVITLLHLEERSTAEISHATGWSISLVKVKAFRARKKMQRAGKRLLRTVGHE